MYYIRKYKGRYKKINVLFRCFRKRLLKKLDELTFQVLLTDFLTLSRLFVHIFCCFIAEIIVK